MRNLTHGIDRSIRRGEGPIVSSCPQSHISTMPRTRVFPVLSCLCYVSIWVGLPQLSLSYPLIAVVDDGQERCFRFNVPRNDDAHLMALVLPGDEELHDDHLLEPWYIGQLHKMARSKAANHGILPLQLLDEIPKEVNERQSRYLEERTGTLPEVAIKITSQPNEDNPHYAFQTKATYFKPAVVNHIVRMLAGKSEAEITSEDKEEASLEGYGVCIHNPDPDYAVHVIFDVVFASEDMSQFDEPVKEKKPTTDFDKERHLTPLERTVDLSIRAARSVLREMKYMEKREARMRVTADSINSRVRWFSYISVGVLLLVTYLQVTYLKRYFHKKKLM